MELILLGIYQLLRLVHLHQEEVAAVEHHQPGHRASRSRSSRSTVIILFMNIVAPSSHDVRSMNYVIPIVPRITGQVTEVPIEPNRPIKKGDVLFKIDPVPFQQAYEAAEAKLAELKVGLITAEAYQRGLDDELKNAEASTQALVARLDLSKKRVEQFTALATTGAGRRAEQEQSESDVANFTSQIAAAKATESKIKQKIEARTAAGEIDEVAQAKAQIAKAEADLIAAKYDLEGTTHSCPGQRARGQPRGAPRRARHPVCDHADHELHRGG